MTDLPPAYVAVMAKLILSVLALILTVVANRMLRKLLKARFEETPYADTIFMLVRNAVFLTGATAVLLIWLGFGSNFAVAMGILGAGIAFASQETIGSFVGYPNIVTSSLYRIGDRGRESADGRPGQQLDQQRDGQRLRPDRHLANQCHRHQPELEL